MGKIGVALLVDTVGQDAGTEKQVAETAWRLDANRFDVHVCCLAARPRLRELGRRCHTAVFPLESVYSPAGLRQALLFRRYVKRHGIQVAHAFMSRTAIFGVCALAGSRSRATASSRLSTGYWYTPFYRRLFGLLNRQTTRIFANSEAVRKVTVEAEGVAPEKIDVIYNGVDIDYYASGDAAGAAALGIPADVRVIAIVANYRPVKDLDLFLRAARIVAGSVPDAVFLLAGQGPLRGELARLAGELGIAGKVFFTDGKGEVRDYLKRACIGCLTSFGEGFSNALIEYMAAGLPVVATAVGGNPEAIEHGETGYLVGERTPEAMAAPLMELLRDEGRRAAMGRRSLERCRSRFAMERYIRDMEEFYTRLAGRT